MFLRTKKVKSYKNWAMNLEEINITPWSSISVPLQYAEIEISILAHCGSLCMFLSVYSRIIILEL